MASFHWYVGSLSLGVFFLSLVGIFDRLLYPLNGYVNTFFGYGIVVVLTLIFLSLTGKIKNLKLKNKKKELFLLALGQLGSAAFTLQAYLLIDFATVGLLLYSAPLWIILFSVITKEEKLTLKLIIPLILGMVGVVLVLNPDAIINQTKNLTGLLLALLAGISYAVSFIYARRIKDEYETSSIVFWGHLIGTIVLLPVVLSSPLAIQKVSLLYFLGIGLSWAIGYAFFYYALKFIKAHLASLIALTEPIFVAIWGYLFFNEPISTFTFVGGIILLINVYFINQQMK